MLKALLLAGALGLAACSVIAPDYPIGACAPGWDNCTTSPWKTMADAGQAGELPAGGAE